MLATLALAVLAATVPSAHAQAPKDRKLISEFQDDRVFTRKGPEALRQALDELQLMGVDMIRTVINWERLAPASLEKTVPAGIDLTDPASYAAPDWDPFDRLVREAMARGIQIHGNPAGATPEWGSGCKVNLYRVCLPKADLFGETAPIGAPPKRTSPIQFYRDLFCLDTRGRRVRGDAARKLGCTKPRPFKVSGVAHHPYVKGAGPPLPKKLTKEAASVGTMTELKRVLRQAGARGMIRRKVPIWITEFGVSTNPPDQKYGVSLNRAAAYLNQVDRYHWLDPQVRSVSQFEYEDDIALNPPTFQTGLRYGNGVAKPGLQAYRLPIFVLPDKSKKNRVIVWGWVRAMKGQPTQVAIQNRAETYGEWQTIRTVQTDRYGFFNVRNKKLKGAWRLAWLPPGTTDVVFSRVARVDNFDRAPQPGFSPPGPGVTPAPDPGGSIPAPDPNNPGQPDPNPPPPNPGPDPNPNPDPNPDPDPPPPPPQVFWNLEVRFNRTRQFDLPTTPFGAGTVRVEPPGETTSTDRSFAFLQGTSVTLTATPASGSSFQGWSGACTGLQTCTVTMNQAKQVTATFRYDQPF